AWIDQKRVSKNIEFLSDAEATIQIRSKKAYQMSLLKAALPDHLKLPVNNFHSFTKTRIMMLNKNNSKKWSYVKPIFMLPLLIIFMLVFQTETVAQNRDSESAIKGAQTEKDNQKDSISVQENFHVLVKNNLSRKDLRELKKSLSKIKDYKADLTNSEFNDFGEVINIDVDARYAHQQK